MDYEPYLYDDLWYPSEYYDPRQFGPQPEFFPPIDETPPFGIRPPRPRPPFFPPIQPTPPWLDGSQGIRRCLNRMTMIWLNNGRSIWFFPINITPQAVIGFRFSRNGWIRDAIARQNIIRFECQ